MASLAIDAVTAAAPVIEGWLGFRQRRHRLPGVQAAIGTAAGPLWQGAFGHADVERGIELTPSHLFRVASHSKTFTAVTVLRLVEEGVLRLDDDVAGHVPYLADGRLAGVTLRELLSHAAGATRDGTAADWWQLGGPFPDDDAVPALAADPLLAPSERFKYSNVGFTLLGAVVAAATAGTYADAARARTVDPLGLADTHPEWWPERADDYAVGYSGLGYADRRIPVDHVDTRAMAAATGFTSTTGDLVRFFGSLADDVDAVVGDRRPLTPRSRRAMRQPSWPVPGGDGERYGLGLDLTTVAGVELAGHGGGYPGHSSRTLVDPATGVAVAVAVNAIDGGAGLLAAGIVELLVASAEEPGEAGRAVGPEADRFCGRFAGLWGVVDVVRLGARLLMLDAGADDPVGGCGVLATDLDRPDRLRLVDHPGYGGYREPLDYEFDAGGAVTAIRGPAGVTLVPEHRMREWVASHDRVSVPADFGGQQKGAG